MTESAETAQEQVQEQQPSIQELAAFAFNKPSPQQQTEAINGHQPATGEPAAANDTPLAATEATNQPTDFNAYLKEHFGVDNLETAKSEWQTLQELKNKPPVNETPFTNEESKKVYHSLKEGKIDEALEVYNAQKRIDKVISREISQDNAAEVIKLKMELSNKWLTPEEIEFQYKQEYLPPKEPIQRKLEEDDEFQERMDEWKDRVQMVEQKRIIAAKMAIPDLQNLKTKIELPDIQQLSVDKDYEAYKASNASAAESYEKVIAPAIKSLKESDVPFNFSVNDTNNKMQFDISIIPDAADFESARQDSLTLDVMKNCYDKDGKFLPQKLQRLILLDNNFDKYAQAIARQAVNAERKRVIEQETAGSGMQRNFTTQVEPSEMDALKQFAFQKTG